MSRNPATLAGADIVLAGDLGPAGAAAKGDDILDAMPMTSGTLYTTSLDAAPARRSRNLQRWAPQRDLGKAINLTAA